MFQTGASVKIHLRGNTSTVVSQGKLARMACPLMAIRLQDNSLHDTLFTRGTNVLLVISAEAGIYSGEAVVQEYHPEVAEIVVQVKGSFRFQQRRQHERYPCNMQVRLRVVGDTEWVTGECRDISAVGARIYLPHELILRSDTVELLFISEANQQVGHAVAEIIRIGKTRDKEGWEIAVRFTEMSRAEKIQFARLLQCGQLHGNASPQS